MIVNRRPPLFCAAEPTKTITTSLPERHGWETIAKQAQRKNKMNITFQLSISSHIAQAMWCHGVYRSSCTARSPAYAFHSHSPNDPMPAPQRNFPVSQYSHRNAPTPTRLKPAIHTPQCQHHRCPHPNAELTQNCNIDRINVSKNHWVLWSMGVIQPLYFHKYE